MRTISGIFAEKNNVSGQLRTGNARLSGLTKGWTFLLCMLSLSAEAQTFRFQQQTSIPVRMATDTLRNAWTGGLNAAQYSTIALNGDATDDLVVFDRTTSAVYTFLAESTATGMVWKYAPQYQTLFPSVYNWMLLADYDKDGKKDLFTSATFGVRVFRNIATGTDLKWQLVADPLLTTSSSGQVNVAVQSTDIPAITDVDNDGDIDLLAGNLIGHRVTWFRNQSIEKTGSPAQLDFRTETQCWGNFEGSEGFCSQFVFGLTCEGGGRLSGGRVKHTGTTLLSLDMTGDATKDLLMAEVGCSTLSQLPNTGTSLQARMLSSTSFTPSKPVTLFFPAAFYEDLDFDGKKDIIATPNVAFNEGNLSDFSQSNWLYKNTGTATQPAFAWIEADFLQKTMIDLGELTTPAFADYDADGDLDLFVGHAGTPASGGLKASVYLYENTGTKTTPSFQFKTTNFANLADVQGSAFRPAFLDWNYDGATDLLLTYTTSVRTQITVFLNTAPAGQPYQFSLSQVFTLPFTNLRSDFIPCLYDLDRDGDYDLLLGKNLGELEYYQNTGTDANPSYTRTQASFAGLPLGTFDRSQAPILADLNANGKPELICGYRNLAEAPYSGNLIVFSDVTPTTHESATPETRILYHSLQQVYDALPLPGYLTPAAADLDNDGLPELVLGTGGGGLIFLQNRSLRKDVSPEDAILIYPNPVENLLFLRTPYDSKVTFFDLLGKQLTSSLTTEANKETPIRVETWATGIYMARITSAEGTYTKRIVITR